MPLPRGFVPPCLPTKAPQPPSGDTWVHEIKHDGFRVIARKDAERVRLYSRPGNSRASIIHTSEHSALALGRTRMGGRVNWPA
jgi:ATP-dependent DNA ligase